MNLIAQRRNLPGLTVTEITPFSHLTKEDRIKVDSAFSSLGNPERVFERKVQFLAELLHCTEAEATRIFLHSL